MLIVKGSFGSLKGKRTHRTKKCTHRHTHMRAGARAHTHIKHPTNPGLSLHSIVWLRLLSPGVTASRWLALSCQSQPGAHTQAHTHTHACKHKLCGTGIAVKFAFHPAGNGGHVCANVHKSESAVIFFCLCSGLPLPVDTLVCCCILTMDSYPNDNQLN